jgi:predicted transglutaminase-like cysteine proteinase
MNKYKVAEEIQFKVNSDIQYQTDIEQYGVLERWCYPKGFGDCEDFALLKRKLLLDRGWDKNKQHLVICKVNGEGHCVLLVNTNKGNYILDNCNALPMPIKDLNYEWLYILKDGEWYEINGIS